MTRLVNRRSVGVALVFVGIILFISSGISLAMAQTTYEHYIRETISDEDVSDDKVKNYSSLSARSQDVVETTVIAYKNSADGANREVTKSPLAEFNYSGHSFYDYDIRYQGTVYVIVTYRNPPEIIFKTIGLIMGTVVFSGGIMLYPRRTSSRHGRDSEGPCS